MDLERLVAWKKAGQGKFQLGKAVRSSLTGSETSTKPDISREEGAIMLSCPSLIGAPSGTEPEGLPLEEAINLLHKRAEAAVVGVLLLLPDPKELQELCAADTVSSRVQSQQQGRYSP